MSGNVNLHVIIPAAGRSRRLTRLTRAKPKSLLRVEGKPIIMHSLDALAERGLRRVTFIVGYMRELLMETLGDRRGDLAIDYVASPDYATTEHGWSLYLSKQRWAEARSAVVFMDADILYDPQMVDSVLDAPHENVMLVDDMMDPGDREEDLLMTRGTRVTAIERGLARDWPGHAGVFVGINRFSASFMGTLYAYMDEFFSRHERHYKYERIFHRFIAETGADVHIATTGGLRWVNVNREEDYALAQAVARRMAASSRADPLQRGVAQESISRGGLL